MLSLSSRVNVDPDFDRHCIDRTPCKLGDLCVFFRVVHVLKDRAGSEAQDDNRDKTFRRACVTKMGSTRRINSPLRISTYQDERNSRCPVYDPLSRPLSIPPPRIRMVQI